MSRNIINIDARSLHWLTFFSSNCLQCRHLQRWPNILHQRIFVTLNSTVILQKVIYTKLQQYLSISKGSAAAFVAEALWARVSIALEAKIGIFGKSQLALYSSLFPAAYESQRIEKKKMRLNFLRIIEAQGPILSEKKHEALLSVALPYLQADFSGATQRNEKRSQKMLTSCRLYMIGKRTFGSRKIYFPNDRIFKHLQYMELLSTVKHIDRSCSMHATVCRSITTHNDVAVRRITTHAQWLNCMHCMRGIIILMNGLRACQSVKQSSK